MVTKRENNMTSVEDYNNPRTLCDCMDMDKSDSTTFYMRVTYF